MIRTGLDKHIVHPATGELLRELTIDPDATASPPANPAAAPESTRPEMRCHRSGMS
jgi:hypothetical protein